MRSLGFVALWALLPVAVFAEDRTLRAAVSSLPPCVEWDASNGRWTGFEVELLRFIANDEGLVLEFAEIPTFAPLFDTLRRGECDVALAGISMNASREALVDFSQPTMRSALGVMVSGSRRASLISSITGWLWAFIPTLLFALCVVVLFGHLTWAAERARNPDFRKEYFPGICDGIWYAFIATTMNGFGRTHAQTAAGCLLTAGIFIVGMGVTSNLCADMSAFKIVPQLDSRIREVDQLAGKTVAVVRGTTGVTSAGKLGASPEIVDSFPQAVAQLKEGRVDAVIFDQPTLRHYESRARGQQVVSLASVSEEHYGFAVAEGNEELLERLNRGLLRLKENGTYDVLYTRFFGERSESR